MSIQYDIDERDRRKPGWVGGRPVRLSDHQDWLMPMVDFRWSSCGLVPDGQWWGMVPEPNPGPDVMRLLRAMTRSAIGEESFRVAFDLASALLLRNYNLDADELRELLPFHPVRFAIAEENLMEASESMGTVADVHAAFLVHVNQAVMNFTAEAIVAGHCLYRIKTAEVAHLYPGD